MAVLGAVTTASDVNPVGPAVGDLFNELVEISLGLEQRKTAFGKFLVGVIWYKLNRSWLF